MTYLAALLLLWSATLEDQRVQLCDALGTCTLVCDGATVTVTALTAAYSCRYRVHCPGGAFVVFSNGFE